MKGQNQLVLKQIILLLTSSSLTHIPSLEHTQSKPKMPDTGYHSASSGTFHGIIGTFTLTDMLRVKKENLDIQEYFNSGDIHKQTPLQRNPRKIMHLSVELQKILSPKLKGPGIKTKQSLFGSSSPHTSSSQNLMDNNEMLRSISSIKTEQMRKLDNLMKAKLPKNYVDGIFQVVKVLGYSINIQDISDITSIPPDSLFRVCAQYIPELTNYHVDTLGPLLRKMFCRYLCVHCRFH